MHGSRFGGGGDDDEIQKIPSVKTESYQEVSSGSQSQLMPAEETDLMYEGEYQEQEGYSGAGGALTDQIYDEGASQGSKLIVLYLVDKVVITIILIVKEFNKYLSRTYKMNILCVN